MIKIHKIHYKGQYIYIANLQYNEWSSIQESGKTPKKAFKKLIKAFNKYMKTLAEISMNNEDTEGIIL